MPDSGAPFGVSPTKRVSSFTVRAVKSDKTTFQVVQPINALTLQYTAMAARGAMLRYLRVNVNPTIQNPRECVLPFSILLRRFSEEVRGSFLDKSEVTDRVLSVVKNFQKVDPSKVTPKANFQNDLGLDSLDSVEVVMALEEEFGFEIPDNEADKIQSIDLAVDFIASHPQAK
jgi:NADH dehydrogenase (ubiquinone) 1 alpha/beta subcomplex 1